MAAKLPTFADRLEQSKKAKGDVSSKAMYEAGTYPEGFEDALKYATAGKTYGSGVAYTTEYLTTSTVPSPVRPPMTIVPASISPKLIEHIMQLTYVEGNNANMFLHKFAYELLGNIEVVYDGDFRLRIKE